MGLNPFGARRNLSFGVTHDQLENIARLHQAELFRYLRYLGADRTAAEDLVQETLVAAYEGQWSGEMPDWEPGRQAGFLRGVARNQWLAHLRKRVRRRERVNTDLAVRRLETSEAEWQEGLLRNGGDGFEYVEALRGCVGKLNARQRDVIEMFYVQGGSREQIGKKVGMTVDGVKTMMRRVRAALADCVRAKLEAEGVLDASR